MKNIFYCILLFTGLSVLGACSNGEYTANPSAAANSSVNPLHPLDSAAFNWASSGTAPISADVNGSAWVADGAYFTINAGANVIYGYKGSYQILELFLTNTWAGNLYSMAYHQYDASGVWADSVSDATNYYESVLGNSGEVQILINNSAEIKGMFYFQGVNGYGAVINITHGYFDVLKN